MKMKKKDRAVKKQLTKEIEEEEKEKEDEERAVLRGFIYVFYDEELINFV